jgi:hypothetical protein
MWMLVLHSELSVRLLRWSPKECESMVLNVWSLILEKPKVSHGFAFRCQVDIGTRRKQAVAIQSRSFSESFVCSEEGQRPVASPGNLAIPSTIRASVPRVRLALRPTFNVDSATKLPPSSTSPPGSAKGSLSLILFVVIACGVPIHNERGDDYKEIQTQGSKNLVSEGGLAQLYLRRGILPR